MVDLKRYGGWALITGASSGIGAAFARAISGQGVPCVLVARRLDRLQALAEEIRQREGVECRCVRQDLVSEGCAENLQQATQDIPIGILVNDAGVGHSGRFESLDPERMIRMIRVNCVAPVILTRAFLPQMLQRKRGAIIMLCSISSFLPVPFDAVYGACKGFDLQFGEALWAELRGRSVDLINVCPYLTRTEFYAAEGMGAEAIEKASKRSHDPRVVVQLALKNLGKRMTVAPWKVTLSAWAARCAPRWAAARMMRSAMADLHFDQV